MQDHSHHHSGTGFDNWIPMIVIVIFALVYLYAHLRLRNKKVLWNPWRTSSFMVGIILLGIAMWPSLAAWAHGNLKGHMVQHLLIGMFAPVFLVLGTPITLALKAASVKIARGITQLLKTNLFYFLSHPVTAFLLNIGGMYILYLTPLYNQTFSDPLLHHFIHLHFLLAGFLFTWSMIGTDPSPKRPGLRVRLFILFLSIASHGILSKLMYAYLFPYNSPHSADEIREAAIMMYYWGDLSELLILIALFSLWYNNRGKASYELSPLVS